jgi:hypothetical protein
LVGLGLISCSTDPDATGLAGAWLTNDSFERRYRGVDGAMHVFRYRNHYPVSVTQVDDSSYTFEIAGGMQAQFDSTEGGAASRDTVFDVELNGLIHVRDDTAFVQLLGKIPLRDGQPLRSHRIVPNAECLLEVGPGIVTPPLPICLEEHHWVR